MAEAHDGDAFTGEGLDVEHFCAIGSHVYEHPTPTPTTSVLPTPSPMVSAFPTVSPHPSQMPTPMPTSAPTPVPTPRPTYLPTVSPLPTTNPSPVPTTNPTPRPTPVPMPTSGDGASSGEGYKVLRDEAAHEPVLSGVVALCLFVIVLTACCCHPSCPLHRSMHGEERGGTTMRRDMDDDCWDDDDECWDDYDHEIRSRPGRTPEEPDSQTNAHHGMAHHPFFNGCRMADQEALRPRPNDAPGTELLPDPPAAPTTPDAPQATEDAARDAPAVAAATNDNDEDEDNEPAPSSYPSRYGTAKARTAAASRLSAHEAVNVWLEPGALFVQGGTAEQSALV